MAREDTTKGWIIVVGAIGIVFLLLGSLGYALRDSGRSFETERINEFAVEQQAAANEAIR